MNVILNLNIHAECAQLIGQLNFFNVLSIRQAGLNYINKQATSVTFNLSEIIKSDSAGVALLIEWWREALYQNKEIKFIHIPPEMMALIKVGNLTDILCV